MDDTEETEHQKSGDDIEEENEFLKPDGYGPEAEQPDRVSKKLYPHQLEAVAWLLQGEHGKILSDFMGLGKTLTTIAYILSLNNDHGYKSALIMVPKSVLKNWVKEIEDSVWKETVSFVVMHGSNPGSFDLSVDDLNKLGFVITTPTRFMGNT
ncbi:DNA repair protein rad16 [Trapelia coarctata]|nr:DNA repair protein rad16 [Trapelia coarctata]